MKTTSTLVIVLMFMVSIGCGGSSSPTPSVEQDELSQYISDNNIDTNASIEVDNGDTAE